MRDLHTLGISVDDFLSASETLTVSLLLAKHCLRQQNPHMRAMRARMTRMTVCTTTSSQVFPMLPVALSLSCITFLCFSNTSHSMFRSNGLSVHPSISCGHSGTSDVASEMSSLGSKAGKESVKSFAMTKPGFVFFVGLFTTRRRCYAIHWG